MVVQVRRAAALLALGLFAACNGSSSDGEVGELKSAHITPFPCNFDTPGFWCGGATTADEQDCQDVGFASCTEMCSCFRGASAAPFSDDPSCPANCGESKAGGMADVLNKMWAAFQLSSLEQCENASGDPVVVEFVCPGAGCTLDGGTTCDTEDVENILEGCNRTQQETLKNCIDNILNAGGMCTFPTDASCTPVRAN